MVDCEMIQWLIGIKENYFLYYTVFRFILLLLLLLIKRHTTTTKKNNFFDPRESNKYPTTKTTETYINTENTKLLSTHKNCTPGALLV